MWARKIASSSVSNAAYWLTHPSVAAKLFIDVLSKHRRENASQAHRDVGASGSDVLNLINVRWQTGKRLPWHRSFRTNIDECRASARHLRSLPPARQWFACSWSFVEKKSVVRTRLFVNNFCTVSQVFLCFRLLLMLKILNACVVLFIGFVFLL